MTKRKEKNFVAIAARYAEEMVSRKILACQWTIKACQRQIDDLEKAKCREYAFKFDKEKASRICRFIEMLPHNVFGQLGEAAFKHPGISSGIQAKVNKKPEGTIAKKIHGLLHFCAGSKPTARTLQDQRFFVHAPSFPVPCNAFFTGRIVSPERRSL